MALLDDIEAFLAKHEEISPTALGDRALGDRHFVRQLRQGRRVWPQTEHKVRAFMAEIGVTLHHADDDAAPRHDPSTGRSDELSGAGSAAA